MFCRDFLLPWQFKLMLPILVIMVMLHVLNRQIEFTARTDFLWQTKLKVEQEEVETMRGINKILLENILPAHVAQHFLEQRKTQVRVCVHQLYEEGGPNFCELDVRLCLD